MAAGLWIAGLALLSFLPVQGKKDLHTKGRFHSAGHFAFFMVAAVLLAMSVRRARSRVAMLCLTGLFGVAVEFTQHVVNHMRVEWNDIYVDLLGVALGGALVAVVHGLRGPESRHGHGRDDVLS